MNSAVSRTLAGTLSALLEYIFAMNKPEGIKVAVHGQGKLEEMKWFS